MASRNARQTPPPPPPKKPEDGDAEVTTHIVVPPDGGWGWVVMCVAFTCNLICDGIIYNFGGVYMASLVEEFGVSDGAVALVGSLIMSSSQFVGPVASALVNRHAFPKVLAFGLLLSTAGFIASYFATSVGYLYFTFGVMAGSGFGITFVVSTVVVSFYFQRWRSIATCFSLCGSTIGAMIGGPLLNLIAGHYGWRIAILAQAVTTFVGSFLGLTYRPLKPMQVQRPDYAAGASQASLVSGMVTTPGRLGPRNHEFPTTAQVVLSETTLALLDNPGTNTRRASGESMVSLAYPAWEPSRASLASVRVVNGPRHHLDVHHLVTGRRHGAARWWRCRGCWAVRWCGRKQEHDLGARPLYRDDIFYGESVTRLPQYTAGHIGYNMAVSRVATRKDVDQERSRRCLLCPEAFTRTLATMLDLALFRSPSFMLYAAVNCLMQFALLMPFIFLPDRAVSVPTISADAVAMLVPAMSLSGFVARLLLGIITSFPSVPLIPISYVILAVGGASVACMGVANEDWSVLTACAVYGVALATFYSFRAQLLVQLLGLPKLTNAFGLLLLFSGCFSVLGPPLAGMVKDATGSYDYVFFLAGTLITLSGVLMMPLEGVNRREKAAAGLPR